MKSLFKRWLFPEQHSGPDSELRAPKETGIPPVEWSGDGCEPLTVADYLEPQLHPDKQLQDTVRNTRSFTDLLAPRVDLMDGMIGLADLTSTGRLFDVSCSNTEARNPEDLQAILKKVMEAISQSVTELTGSPWILQWFVQDENISMYRGLASQVGRYTSESIRDSDFSRHWFGTLNEHFLRMIHDNGLFPDVRIAGGKWRGRSRRIRLCIWRIQANQNLADFEDLDQICNRLKNSLEQAQVELIPRGAKDLYEWLTHWFVPRPMLHTGFSDTFEMLQAHPWNPSELARAASVFSDSASSDISRASLHGTSPWTWKIPGIWWFCGQPSRFVTVDELTAEPDIGHLTGELAFGESVGTFWDRMPEKSIWSMSIVYSPQDQIEKKIQKVRKNSVGDDPAATERRNLANTALMEITRSNPVYRVFCGVFVFGKNLAVLNRKTDQVLSLLSSHKLRPVAPRYDPIALDSYVRALPFGFSVEQDERPYARRARLWFSSHIAKVLPVYGRSTGTGYPGCILFNRGAEPLMFDPLNPADREKNAHSLILGPTGSGKTAFLIYLLLHMTAVHRPRIVLLSALPTFGLFADHCESQGLSVHRVRIDGKNPVSLPPFKHAQSILDSETAKSKNTDQFHRDPLGEMEIQARLMITGGQENEENRLRRDDIDLIRVALKQAARKSLAENRSQTLTSDLVSTLFEAARSGTIDDRLLTKHQIRRAIRMASAINVFCSGLNGQLFDREGDLWPRADITVVELDLLARRGYEDRLAVALTGLFSMINNEIESNQYTTRQTLVVIDEAHVLLQNALISPYINRISAMWRTYGAWLWIATQNIRQFPDNAKELLNQPEWWYCLSLDKDEIDQIGRFKSLTAQQKDLLLSARKSPGLYTEGTIISARLISLFRNTPPALALALSQTEKSEKAQRFKLMKEKGITELEAAHMIAEIIANERSQRSST